MFEYLFPRLPSCLRGLVRFVPGLRHQLDAMGFSWESSELRWELIFSALVRFRRLHGDLLVPTGFNVPPDLSLWPEPMHGLKLGLCVANLRAKKTYLEGHPERCAALDELDFCWDLTARAFDQVNRSSRPSPSSPPSLLRFPRLPLAPSSRELWGTDSAREIMVLFEKSLPPLPRGSRKSLSSFGLCVVAPSRVSTPSSNRCTRRWWLSRVWWATRACPSSSRCHAATLGRSRAGVSRSASASGASAAEATSSKVSDALECSSRRLRA
jgi:hypothetical protein